MAVGSQDVGAVGIDNRPIGRDDSNPLRPAGAGALGDDQVSAQVDVGTVAEDTQVDVAVCIGG